MHKIGLEFGNYREQPNFNNTEVRIEKDIIKALAIVFSYW